MRPGLSRRRLLAGGAAILASPASGATPLLDGVTRIDVRAVAIAAFSSRDAGRTRFGALEFRGGLELSSRHAAFGGLSGLSISADGARLVAVTDRGVWMTARIAYAGRRPAAMEEVTLAPMLDASGRQLRRSRAFDTECLCLHDGVAYVGIERVNQVLRYDWARAGFAARGRPVPLPPAASSLPFNRGFEAIGVVTDGGASPGALVAIAEQAREGANAPTLGFILTGPQRGGFEVVRSDDFDVTDLVFLPGGDVLLLERRFTLLRGVAMRIRRLPGRTIRPGARLDGPVLITADMGEQIDNMEGIAFHREPGGAGIVTLISDDNFSGLQRNVLLQFALADAA